MVVVVVKEAENRETNMDPQLTAGVLLWRLLVDVEANVCVWDMLAFPPVLSALSLFLRVVAALVGSMSAGEMKTCSWSKLKTVHF